MVLETSRRPTYNKRLLEGIIVSSLSSYIADSPTERKRRFSSTRSTVL
uniref:Uncharacterized protein n=1 Tax=Anguilla anguilla TaxID=7936 RepID=A0A0E9UXD5_ANGAN